MELFNVYSKIGSMTKYREIHGRGLKILTPKQMFQGSPIALAQVKLGNTSENLLNKTCQIIVLCIKKNKLLKKYMNLFLYQILAYTIHEKIKAVIKKKIYIYISSNMEQFFLFLLCVIYSRLFWVCYQKIWNNDW